MINKTARNTLVGAAILALSACSSSATPSAPASSPSAAPAATQPSANVPAEGPATYALRVGRIDIGGVDAPLVAKAGVVAVSSPVGGAQTVTVRGTRSKGRQAWVLDLAITNQGRASGGTLVSAGRTWNVTPGTGIIRVVRQGQALTMITVNAVTLTESTAPSVNTPMVVNISV